MHVARLDLCAKLFALTGWDDTYHRWSKDIYHKDVVIDTLAAGTTTPAYDLGYLLRKLPPQTRITKEFDASEHYPEKTPAFFRALYDTSDDLHFWQGANTPEDAACILALTLLERNLLDV